jgi:hypothetical protein
MARIQADLDAELITEEQAAYLRACERAVVVHVCLVAAVREEEAHAAGWVLVEDRLPEEDNVEGLLLIWGPYLGQRARAAFYQGRGCWQILDGAPHWVEAGIVTHWRPAPPPPVAAKVSPETPGGDV